MTISFKLLATSALLALAPAIVPASVAHAQTVTVTPLPAPTNGGAPAAGSDEDKTHDADAIEQLLNLVELSRYIGGGISQIFGSFQSMTSLLGAIRDTANAQLTAVTGTKTVPLANGPDDIAARDAGPGVRQMATEGLGGAVASPPDISTVFSNLVTTYELDKVFKYNDETRLNEVTMAHMASYGAVAVAIGDRAYKRANTSMGRIDGYITALGASADLKTSLDINTRANIELAQQLNELVRTQATLTTIAGMYYVTTLSSRTDIADNLNLQRLFFSRD